MVVTYLIDSRLNGLEYSGCFELARSWEFVSFPEVLKTLREICKDFPKQGVSGERLGKYVILFRNVNDRIIAIVTYGD